MSKLIEPGRNCWRIEQAERFSVIIDAEQYFLAARETMMKAKKSIMLIGWDFDARIRLGSPGQNDGAPDTLGDFILWLVDREPNLHIRLLQWDSRTFSNLFRGTNILYLLRWKAHKRITARMDATLSAIASHHQKLLVVDDSIAFCGGIDMTMNRWDTREHADVQPARTTPSGKQMMPWHDLASIFEGPAARAIGDHSRLRWQRACGEVLQPVVADPVAWPKAVVPLAHPAHIGIARSQPSVADEAPVREVEALYLDTIAQAKTLIYAESQYFASRRIAAAMASRLEEPDGPEVVIINPTGTDGWLEPLAMDNTRARLVESLRRHGPRGRFALYHPVTAQEKPIYVHAKMMIADDRILRIGSSNFNNRSMRLDSECDVVLDADQDNSGVLARRIADLRHDLVAEHLGQTTDAVAAAYAREGSLIRAIETLRGAGRSLVPYVTPELSSLEAWIADNEILDPDGPEEVFESLSKRGLFRGRLRRPKLFSKA